MKAYFARLFNYDHYANALMLDIIIKAGSPQKPVQLMAHLLAAQQIWINRCKALPAIGGALWPDWSADTLPGIMTENSIQWGDFIDGLQPEDFDKIISYKNSKGEDFENNLTDILTHVINHGTHHRAQAGQHLKAAGFELPMMDYIFYVRQSNN
ncbi:MAG: hypothetical protein JWP44_796 [Mucilaginibacter sp.]|nr:hypothetical protein [Mucilaginibacter sp.]